jgi:hypothetical protein
VIRPKPLEGVLGQHSREAVILQKPKARGAELLWSIGDQQVHPILHVEPGSTNGG